MGKMPDEEIFVEALNKLKDRNLTWEEFLFYHYRSKNMLDEWSAIHEAELRVQEAREKSLEEGKAEIEKEFARNLLKEGVDPEMILKVTGIDKEMLVNIQKDHH